MPASPVRFGSTLHPIRLPHTRPTLHGGARAPSLKVRRGISRGAVTGDDGRYRIAGMRPGQYQVRALRLGYQASSQSVDVTSGGTAEANFSLAAAAISLEQVVTTATGEQERKREIGSAVS